MAMAAQRPQAYDPLDITPTLPVAPPLSARLRLLLDEAGQALGRAAGGDMDRARGCIARAAALLREDAVERQEMARSEPARGQLAPWQVRAVTRFVETHIARNIAIEELAALARLSPSHFSKRFRGSMGLSPYNYVIARRVALAQEVMTSTDEGLSEIALRCGFSDQAHFSRVFKRVTGDSPNAWRRLQRGRAGSARREGLAAAAFDN
ncbi:hypothetical protein GCM10007301_41880 [Azorhizobium oxalatiphilum]|uniref:HTH araC/xylS-type domain-containing protein n=1 Tax=Azorhizobium oxalatiphilum TaxID=980631 RepID=A0A917C8B1_9HYPH|nr:AraC family transcriptional regulator [Azorhizobium oxalatiphilum]GGF77553.1 hypothetical protein GCM10007301_41880 [Azorhizobium oxalatiphilum]